MENAFGYLSLELVKQKNGLKNKLKKERKSNLLSFAKVAKDFGFMRIFIRYYYIFPSGNLKYRIHYFNSLETVTKVSTSTTSTRNDIDQDIGVSMDTSTTELQFSTTQDTLWVDESRTTGTEGIWQLFGF